MPKRILQIPKVLQKKILIYNLNAFPFYPLDHKKNILQVQMIPFQSAIST